MQFVRLYKLHLPELESEEVVETQVDIIEDLYTSIVQDYPNYFPPLRRLAIEEFIKTRRQSGKGEEVLSHKETERKNFIAVFQALGAYDKYEYSVRDLSRRMLMKDGDVFLEEIKRNEQAGTASSIHITDGVEQYVALHNSTSSFYQGAAFFEMYG